MITSGLLLLLLSQGPAIDYEFIPEPNRLVNWQIGKRDCYGRIDADGNFMPDFSRDGKPISGPGWLLLGVKDGQFLYEYRSGRLVPMVYQRERGVIPEIGGKIIDFKNYKYSPTSRHIYNLPGRFQEKAASGGGPSRPRDNSITASLPLVLPLPSQPPGTEYVFIPEPNKFVNWQIGKRQCYGNLDSDGNFLPDFSLDGKPVSGPGWLLQGVKDKQLLYEYRSGLLVPMVYERQRGVIPEIGGKIIDFKDYKYSPSARLIYNLPGYFRLQDKAPDKK